MHTCIHICNQLHAYINIYTYITVKEAAQACPLLLYFSIDIIHSVMHICIYPITVSRFIL